MYVCICHSVTDSDIKEALDNGISSLDGISDALGVGTGCGSCISYAQDIVSESLAAGDQAIELCLYEMV